MTKSELIEALRPYAPRYLTAMSKAQLIDELALVTRNLKEFGEAYPLPQKIFDKRDTEARGCFCDPCIALKNYNQKETK